MRKFINTLDYSLDLIKMRESYPKACRRVNFSFNKDGYEYTQQVINVTFKYSNKEYNRCNMNLYIKQGWSQFDIALKDNIYIVDNELIAIQVNEKVSNPVDNELLGSYFSYDDKLCEYKVTSNIKVTHTVADLREWVYKNGFVCDGIRYVRYKRSSGSSRVGKCLFINEKLYPTMHRWEMCGLYVRKDRAVDLAALEAYISLTLSSIIDTIEINPENILVIDDYESVFKDRCVAVTYNGKQLQADIDNVDISNSIWDGQSLLDKSMFGKYEDCGMVLLRNRFFKSCCFNTNLQAFFADNGITDISQLNGFTLATNIEDVKMITTPSSIKYVKFGSIDEWMKRLDPVFGLVKHEKKTQFFNGRMVQTHYQLLNSLHLTQEEVDELLKPSLDYLKLIKTNPSVLRYYIKYNHNDDSDEEMSFATRNDVVYTMLGINDKFVNTRLYRNFKKETCKAFVKDLRRGHVLIGGNYSVLCGNPYEMLLASIGLFTGESSIPRGSIVSTRFKNGETVLGCRSPHVASGNLLVAKNCKVWQVLRYLNITKEIVCVNSIGENLLERLSGADFDSDTMLLTNNKILVDAAQKNYDLFPVPTKLVASKKISRRYTSEQQADLDIKTAVNKIGEIVNLSQELNTRMWDMYNAGEDMDSIMAIYKDIAMLDVMSNIEIDSAKREYVVNNSKELIRLKNKYRMRDEEDNRMIKPNFLGRVARYKGFYNPQRNKYEFHDSTMDYVQHTLNKIKTIQGSRKIVPFSDVLVPKRISYSHVQYEKIDEIINSVREMKARVNHLYKRYDIDSNEKRHICSDIRKECIDKMAHMSLNSNTMYMLLLSIEEEKNSDIAVTFMNMLFKHPTKDFFTLVQESKEKQYKLVENLAQDVKIYDFWFGEV